MVSVTLLPTRHSAFLTRVSVHARCLSSVIVDVSEHADVRARVFGDA